MKIYKRFFESKPKILYHATNKKNVPSILRVGLKVDNQGFIYLMEKPKAWNDEVFEITIPYTKDLIDWRDAWYDDNGEEFDMDHEYDEDNPYWLYLNNIPPKYLRLLNKKETMK